MNLLEISQPSSKTLFESFSKNPEGYDINDLILIAREYLLEAKNKKSSDSNIKIGANNAPSVVFRETRLWAKTVEEKFQHLPELLKKIEGFKECKLANKLQPFGQGDSLFTGNAPIGNTMPGLRHAHVTRDLSIIYDLSGSNPTVITLYGVFSHRDMGTGTPANVNKQKAFAKGLKSL